MEHFWENFGVVGAQVGILLLLILLGYLCRRIGFLNEQANRCISDIVIYITTPVVIIRSFFSCARTSAEEIRTLLSDIGSVALAAAAIHIAMIVLSLLILRSKEEDRRAILRFAAIFSNCGFMGLPLAQSLIDSRGGRGEGALFAAVWMAVFNIFVWTVGVMMTSGEKKIRPVKLILNPGVIGVLGGMILLIFPLMGLSYDRLPAQVLTVFDGTLTHIGNMNVPLPMMLVGYGLADADFRTLVKDRGSYLCIALRLLAFPLAALGVLLLCGVRGPVLLAIMACLSAPSGTMTTIFATRYGSDVPLSTRLVTSTTILSLLTMPLVVGLAQTLS